tara:strand:- start:1079 stop:1216 length:138 start_codon:yes stop_codon:yes gene_type:complete
VKILLLEILSVIVFFKIMKFIMMREHNDIEDNLKRINKIKKNDKA